MYNELNLTVSNEKHKAFFMNGFLSPSDKPTSNLHKHIFSEIHFIAGGNATFRIEDTQLELKSGSLIIVPQGVFHCCQEKEECTLHNAFQIDYEVESIRTATISTDTLLGFFDEIDICKNTENYSGISPYIELLCNALGLNRPVSTNPVTDYGFLIHEYMSLHYSESLRLSDLAKELHVSERQAERIVKECTGKSFKDELCAIRINIAKQLMDNSVMSLTEISRYVGYESYAGFWKAMKKYNFT